MKITKLILEGYKRVFLNEINRIDYAPNAGTQVLLSTNGSGKSSLLYQLTPLPANINKDFKEGGSKYIEIEHHNKEYKLLSGIKGKNKHSFICNDEEYNPGGTGRVQLQLVKEHFKITPHIHQILLGNNNFTTMSPMERKKWITEISTIDYSYPIAVYNKMKQRHRDIVGGIKIIQENVVKMENGLLSDKDLRTISDNRDSLSSYIEHLLSLLSHNVQNSEFNTMLNELDNYNKRLKYLLLERGIKPDTDINTLHIKRKQLTDRNIVLSKELDQLDKIKETTVDKTTTITNIDRLKLNSKTIRDSIYITADDIQLTIRTFNNSYSDIVGIISELAEFTDVKSDREYYVKLDNDLTRLGGKKNGLDRRLNLIETEILTLEKLNTDDNKVECPKCSNIWHLNYSSDKHELLKADRITFLTQIEEVTKSETLLTKELEEIKSKRTIINNINSMIRSQLAVRPVFISILGDHNIHTDPVGNLLNKLEKVNLDMRVWETLEKVESELKEQELALNEILLSEKLKEEFRNINADKLKTELDSNTVTINQYKKEISEVERYLVKENTLEELSLKITEQVSNVYKGKKKYLNNIRNEHLKELIGLLKEEHLELTNKLNDATGYTDKIKEDRKRLEDYNAKEKVLRLMLKELSPSEGLIAKSINSFLNVFIRDINNLVNTVWSYNMTILPCEISAGNDLDYKFRVRVNNTETIEDIGKTSSSMQEMINLAFKIVFAKYVGLEDTPLILDEFGSSFDATHRISAYETIDRVIANKFSQIFIVSHFSELYMRFGNADINILNPDGVDTTGIDEYNKVMKLS